MAKPNNTLDGSSLDRLETLHSAYVGLEVLAGIADVDSHHVANVLGILNEAFQTQIDGFTPKKYGLRRVDN